MGIVSVCSLALPVDISMLAQPVDERVCVMPGGYCGSGPYVTYPRDRPPVLRLRGERRGDRSDTTDDERAPVHYSIT